MSVFLPSSMNSIYSSMHQFYPLYINKSIQKLTGVGSFCATITLPTWNDNAITNYVQMKMSKRTNPLHEMCCDAIKVMFDCYNIPSKPHVGLVNNG